ncbi:MAG TPA: iron-sulfur cluster assembly scaffold protein [Syntrophorhabdaceae bacterium]|nr:iron-sulfur cluster assembly scaffold protein [Syntrophorhabdaceae bacterium]HNT69915.1 iron-sulfur cluster assembly scaffold protein [Syntrophorhabdaceae bacterium]
MSDNLDEFLKELQDKIFDDTIRDYGQKAFDRWRNPLHMHPMENPDGYGRITGPCGDTMEIFLRFEKGKVSKASFQTDGCGPSIVCGSLAAELALGKQPDEIRKITNETILETIGGLPEESRHCALLAANTLREAVDRYTKQKATGKDNIQGNNLHGG